MNPESMEVNTVTKPIRRFARVLGAVIASVSGIALLTGFVGVSVSTSPSKPADAAPAAPVAVSVPADEVADIQAEFNTLSADYSNGFVQLQAAIKIYNGSRCLIELEQSLIKNYDELIHTVQPQMQTLQAAVTDNSTDFPVALLKEVPAEMKPLAAFVADGLQPQISACPV